MAFANACQSTPLINSDSCLQFTKCWVILLNSHEMAGLNLLKDLQGCFGSTACKARGPWNDKLWAEVSLPCINIPRHSLRNSHFILGNWFVWTFIWFKKNNSLIICQVMCFYISAPAFIEKYVYLQKSRDKELCLCTEYSPACQQRNAVFQGIENLPIDGIEAGVCYWNTHAHIRGEITWTTACKYSIKFQP